MNKDRFINACRCELVDRPPVWLYRQAGRYLPEYREIRKKYSTKHMMQTPELASTITVQPVDIIGVDAAIIYSDILMIPDALGMDLKFVEGEGPRFLFAIDDAMSLTRLNASNVCDRLDYVFEAIRLSLKKLPQEFPLIGFAGAPLTVACYMMAGGSWKNFDLVKAQIKKETKTFRWLLDMLTEVTVEYLVKQVHAGACVVQLFDTWAGELSVDEYRLLAKPFSEKIFSELQRREIPSIHFIRQRGHLTEEMFSMSSSVVSVGEAFEGTKGTQMTQRTKAVQGNLNPEILLKDKQTIQNETKKMLLQVPDLCRGYIANLSHGVKPETPVENVKFFVETVQKLF